MERMNGHPLDCIERRSSDATPDELAKAKKVHEQLTDIILQLGKFAAAVIHCVYLSLLIEDYRCCKRRSGSIR